MIDGRTLDVQHQAGLASLHVPVSVAERRLPRPAPPAECRTHPGLGPLGLLVVVELRDRGQHVLGELPDGVVADRLVHRPQRHAEAQQQGADDDVVVGVAREPGDVVDDHELDAALVGTAIRQEPLKLGAVRRLRGLAGVLEHLGDVDALTSAVGLARL